MPSLSPVLTSTARVGADLAGRSLSVLINRVYGRGRPRPLHPVGTVREGRWIVFDAARTPRTRTGAPCLDEAGTHPCLVRHSRAIGLPPPWPDIEGIAVRLGPLDAADSPDGGDLLFAGTGAGALTRHLLVVRRVRGTCTTLLPLLSPAGAITLRLTPDGEDAWHLEWARVGGRWERVGRLELGAFLDTDPAFDPIEHPPTGLRHPPALAALRRPSYRQAHRQRD